MSWQKLESISESTGMSSRSGHTAILWNDQVIVFGGFTGTEVLNDVWSFEIEKQEWSMILPCDGVDEVNQ